MLSAIAVGYGARPELGRIASSTGREMSDAFWEAECKAVYGAWADDFETYTPRKG